MNIISYFHKFVDNSFNNFLKNYFIDSNYWYKESNFNNYINFMNDLDSFNYTFITNVIKLYFEYIDDVFFNSSYRKSFCKSKGFYKRTILTLFGEVTFKRRYYIDKNTNEKYFFLTISSTYLNENILTHLFLLKFVMKLLPFLTLKLE